MLSAHPPLFEWLSKKKYHSIIPPNIYLPPMIMLYEHFAISPKYQRPPELTEGDHN